MKALAKKSWGLIIIVLVGIAMFSWPFFDLNIPSGTPLLMATLATITVFAFIEIKSRKLNLRKLILLSAIAAIDAGMRMALITGVGGFSPVFFLILCSGFVFGPSYGFLTGATSLLVSALATGGVGPWLPYQIFAAGGVGLVAGLFSSAQIGMPTRRELLVLAFIGVVTGYGFGTVMDIWDWSFFQRAPDIGWAAGMAPFTALTHFAKFYLTTSLIYDSFRAVGNAIMILSIGPPIIWALRRFRTRLTYLTVENANDLKANFEFDG